MQDVFLSFLNILTVSIILKVLFFAYNSQGVQFFVSLFHTVWSFFVHIREQQSHTSWCFSRMQELTFESFKFPREKHQVHFVYLNLVNISIYLECNGGRHLCIIWQCQYLELRVFDESGFKTYTCRSSPMICNGLWYFDQTRFVLVFFFTKNRE